MRRWILVTAVLAGSACTDKGGSDDSTAGSDTATGADPDDADGDGYRAESAGGTDCDDGDPTVNPAAPEIWYDGVDQDCDGASDYDADGDGSDSEDHGGEDCDDGEFWTGPGSLELCTGALDEDCDGLVDEEPCGWTTDHAAGLWHQADLPYLGTALVSDCDLAGTGALSVLASAPGDPGEWDETAKTWVDVAEGGVYTAADASGFFPGGGLTVVRSGSRAAFGTALDCGGDLDGDGYRDLAIGAFDDGGDRTEGRTVVLLGPLSGALDAAVADYEWVGREEGTETLMENIGATVRVADITGDEVQDVVIGIGDSYSPWGGASTWTVETGATVVYRGPVEAPTTEGWDGGLFLMGDLQGELAVGDVDGDGTQDVVRNYPPSDTAPSRCGVVYSGVDIAAAAEWDVLSADSGAVSVLHCPTDTWPPDYVWKLRADQDLDQDGYADLFMVHNRGWSAFQGDAVGWAGEVEATSRLEASFCELGLGVRDVDFTRGEDGLLTWAVSLDGSPDCPTYTDTPFRGRVAIFEEWSWTDLVFDDAASWIAWDADSFGLDPQKIGSREVAFSHEDGTRLWFADPTWTRGAARVGRLVAFDLDEIR